MTLMNLIFNLTASVISIMCMTDVSDDQCIHTMKMSNTVLHSPTRRVILYVLHYCANSLGWLHLRIARLAEYHIGQIFRYT